MTAKEQRSGSILLRCLYLHLFLVAAMLVLVGFHTIPAPPDWFVIPIIVVPTLIGVGLMILIFRAGHRGRHS
jgi:hypothetical protein